PPGAAHTAGPRGRDEAGVGGRDRRRRAASCRGPGACPRRARVDSLASGAHRRRGSPPRRGISHHPRPAAANSPRAPYHAARGARRPGGQRSPGGQRCRCRPRSCRAGQRRRSRRIPARRRARHRVGCAPCCGHRGRGDGRGPAGERGGPPAAPRPPLSAASLFTPPSRPPHRWRGELSLSAGASSYADFASFWHATGEARLHFVTGGGGGAWIGGTGGRTSYGRAPRPVAVAGVGVWTRRAEVTVAASATRSIVGDTAYSDVGSTLHARRGRVEVDGSLAARVWSRGAGHGVYGEASATYTLGERTALF